MAKKKRPPMIPGRGRKKQVKRVPVAKKSTLVYEEDVDVKVPEEKLARAESLVSRILAIYEGIDYESPSDLPHAMIELSKVSNLVAKLCDVWGENYDNNAERLRSLAVFFSRRVGQIFWKIEHPDLPGLIDMKIRFCRNVLNDLGNGEEAGGSGLSIKEDVFLDEKHAKKILFGAEWVEEPEDPDDYPLLVSPQLQKLIADRGEWYVPIELNGYGLVDAFEHPTKSDIKMLWELT